MADAELESGGGGAESGWKTHGRLKTPLTDGAEVAARQGGRSEERCGYARLLRRELGRLAGERGGNVLWWRGKAEWGSRPRAGPVRGESTWAT